MMTIKEFSELIEDYQRNREEISRICEILPCFFDMSPVEYGNLMFEKLITTYFEKEGVEWIFWWLFDKNGDPEMKAFDKSGIEMPTETVKDLWNLVKKYLKNLTPL